MHGYGLGRGSRDAGRGGGIVAADDEDLEAPGLRPPCQRTTRLRLVAVDVMHVAQVLRLRDDMAPPDRRCSGVHPARASGVGGSRLWPVLLPRCRRVNVRDLVKSLADPLL